jgi:hypothetical protein
MINFQLLLIGVALTAIPMLVKLVVAVLRLLVKLVTGALFTGIGLLVLVSMASHGKLI